MSQFDLIIYSCHNETIAFKHRHHSFLQVNFNLIRHIGYFLIQMYVPCALIVILSRVFFGLIVKQ